MKRIIAAVALCGSTLLSFSQESDQLTFNGWGIRASLDISMPGKWDIGNGDKVKAYKPGAGLAAGVVYNQPLGGSFYFEPGASLFYDTYSFDDFTLGIPDPSEAPVTISPRISRAGIRIPLDFGYTFNFPSFCFSLYTGPELCYSFYGHVENKKEWDLGDDFSTNIFDQGYRRFDCVWKVGVSIPMQRWVVGIEGAFGMVDQYKHDIKFHENRLNIVLGYDF